MRAEADAPVGPEDRAHHVQQRPLEIREREAAIDGEPFELVEDRIVRRVDRVAAVAAPERDHVDRRLLLLHRVDLRGRGLGAQHVLGVEEERRARRARRVPLIERELVEVVVHRLDLPVVAHLVAEAEERVLDGAPHLRDRVQAAERQLLAGKRDVDDLLAQPPVELVAGECPLALVDRSFEPLADAVQQHPGLAVAHRAERQRELALAPEEPDAHVLDRVGARRVGDRAARLGFVRLPVDLAQVFTSSGRGPNGRSPGS